MSTPPVPPANQDEPESGGQNAPQYGQNTPPQYGQNAPQQPQYGQNAPQYGQNAPQQPQFGAPQYGQDAPQQPQYGQNAPQYGQNPAQQQFGQNQFGQPQQGQSPYGQSPYGQSPYSQYPSELPSAGNSNRPPQVDLAFWLIIGAGVLSFISSMVFVFSGGDYFTQVLQEQAELQGTELPAGTIEGMQGMVVGFVIVFGLISLGLYALVAFPVRAGKNWARILGTVFAALSVFGLFNVFSMGPTFGVLQILVILMGVAGIVLLYLPANSPYFQKQQPFASPYSQPYGR
jgi:hypothetical protein